MTQFENVKMIVSCIPITIVSCYDKWEYIYANLLCIITFIYKP